jgi:hypothetical protein
MPQSIHTVHHCCIPPFLLQLFNRVWPISDKDTQQRKEFYKVRLRSRSRSSSRTSSTILPVLPLCCPSLHLAALLGVPDLSYFRLQRAEGWLKESGQLEAHGNSLQPFVRNPFGPK